MNRVTALTESELPGTFSARSMSNPDVRIELVDTAHPFWQDVMRAIVRAGGADTLLICEDGRLSARQIVLAALHGDDIVGHLVFHIEPGTGRSLRSQLDCFEIEPGYGSIGIDRMLANTAKHQATLRRCEIPTAVAC